MTVVNRRYAELTTAEVPAALSRDSVLVLPTGAIEPHGPHLPLATDIILAEAIATALVDRTGAAGNDTWLMPSIAYAKSDEHANLPGTVWLSAHTLLSTITDIGRSIAATPARRLLFVNGHGGNSALLEVACRELRRQYGIQTFLYAGGARQSPESERGFGIHAGHTETSMMLHVRPDLVDMSRAIRSVPDSIADLRHVGFGKTIRFGWLSDDFAESGVIGDPTGANATHGEQSFEEVVTTLVAAMGEIESFDPGRVHDRMR